MRIYYCPGTGCPVNPDQGGRTDAGLGPFSWHCCKPFRQRPDSGTDPYLYSQNLAILALVLWGPWMLTVLLQFAHELLVNIPYYIQ